MSRTPGTDAAKELSKLMARDQLDDSGALNSMLVVLVDELGGIRDELGGIRDALIAEKQAHAKLRAEVEKLRDRKRSLSKTQYQTARDLKNGIFDETFGTMPETHTVEAWEMGARSNQRTATALTRILEATDD